jgi:hypothetical protein
MPSIPAHAFRDRVAASLSPDAAQQLDQARGSGPAFREMHRTLMLADRAARAWAASAIASARPDTPNRFQHLGQLGKPEDSYHDLEPAARAESNAATSEHERELAVAVQHLAAVVPRLDTEDTVDGNTPAMREAAEAAADVLVKSAALVGGEAFIVEQANSMLGDLVALAGWTNQLGPRFE